MSLHHVYVLPFVMACVAQCVKMTYLGTENLLKSEERSIGIPLTVFVTGKWDPLSRQAAEAFTNLQQSSLLERSSHTVDYQRVHAATIQPFLPNGTTMLYFTDYEMQRSVCEISLRLSDAGVVDDAYDAFMSLRPMAFRADLWRYMILWDQGGVYLDVNLKLLAPLTDWINFTSDDLVLVEDRKGQKYWNAMMAASPREDRLARVIRSVVSKIKHNYYGPNCLSITGPAALWQALRGQRKPRVEYKWTGLSVVDLNMRKRHIAAKDSHLHELLSGFGHKGSQHYSVFWKRHEVYCDEAIQGCPKAFSSTCAALDLS